MTAAALQLPGWTHELDSRTMATMAYVDVYLYLARHPFPPPNEELGQRAHEAVEAALSLAQTSAEVQ